MPEFKFNEYRFCLTQKDQSYLKADNNSNNRPINNQVKILERIMNNPTISTNELANYIEISRTGNQYHLNKLNKSGKIQHVGSSSNGFWKVLPH